MHPVRRPLSAKQRQALDDIGRAYCSGRVTFEVAVECRDMVRAGCIDEAYAALMIKANRRRAA